MVWSLELFSDPTKPDFGKPLRQFPYERIPDAIIRARCTDTLIYEVTLTAPPAVGAIVIKLERIREYAGLHRGDADVSLEIPPHRSSSEVAIENDSCAAWEFAERSSDKDYGSGRSTAGFGI